jgi:hypothetical protein
MRTYEQAAFRLAIKRVLKSNNINEGYRCLNKWCEENKDNLIIDIEKVKFEFTTWVNTKYINQSI